MRTLTLLTLSLLAGCAMVQALEEGRRLSMCTGERVIQAGFSEPLTCNLPFLTADMIHGDEEWVGDIICRADDGTVVFETTMQEMREACPVSAMADYPR